jgi:hypothetical protein
LPEATQKIQLVSAKNKEFNKQNTYTAGLE